MSFFSNYNNFKNKYNELRICLVKEGYTFKTISNYRTDTQQQHTLVHKYFLNITLIYHFCCIIIFQT